MLPLGLLLFSLAANAQDAVERLFDVVAEGIPSLEIRLAPNLNDRELATGSSELPRLRGFADLPPGASPDSAEIEAWEAAFRAGEIGGLVLHSEFQILSRTIETRMGKSGDLVGHRWRHHYGKGKHYRPPSLARRI